MKTKPTYYLLSLLLLCSADVYAQKALTSLQNSKQTAQSTVTIVADKNINYEHLQLLMSNMLTHIYYFLTDLQDDSEGVWDVLNEETIIELVIIILLLLIVDILVALVGRRRKIGYWRALLFCILLTPIIGLIIIFCSKKKYLQVTPNSVKSEKTNSSNIKPIPNVVNDKKFTNKVGLFKKIITSEWKKIGIWEVGKILVGIGIIGVIVLIAGLQLNEWKFDDIVVGLFIISIMLFLMGVAMWLSKK